MKKEIKIHAAGGRFDEFNGYPPDALSTLAAWEKLVRAIVRDRYKAANGVDVRVPGELDAGLRFAVTSIVGGGSADGVVGFSFADDSPYTQFYAEAAGAAHEILGYLEADGRRLPATWSTSTKQQLVAIQDGLRTGETLAVQLPVPGAPVSKTLSTTTLTRALQIRGELLADQRAPEWLCGRIDGITRDPWTVGFKMQGARRSTTIPCGGEFWDAAVAAFHDEALVRLRVSFAPPEDGGAIESILSLTRVEGPNFDARLTELESLEDDWVAEGSGSIGPSKALLKRVRTAIWEVITEHGERTPYIFPKFEGGVEAQWHDDNKTRILLFERGTKTVLPILIDLEQMRTKRGDPVANVADALKWLREVRD